MLDQIKSWLFGRTLTSSASGDQASRGQYMSMEVDTEAQGYGDICILISKVERGSAKERSKAMDKIRELFGEMSTKNSYYGALKCCRLSIDFLEASVNNFSGSDVLLLLKIATMNHSGFVRQYAVNKLAGYRDPGILPFFIYRLADWVHPVRDSAKAQIYQRLNSQYLKEVMDNAYLSIWLMRVQRVDLSSVHKAIFDFCLIDHLPKMLELFPHTKDRNRLVLAHELLKRTFPAKAIEVLIEDSYYLVRLSLVRYFDRLTEANKQTLIKDRSARVRQESLAAYVNTNGIGEYLVDYLTDNSSNIRFQVRHHLKDRNIDYVKFYQERLLANVDVRGSILGLNDISHEESIPLIETYVDSQDHKVVQATLFFLSNYDSLEADGYVTDNVLNSTEKSRAIFRYLEKKRTGSAIEKLRDNFEGLSTPLKRMALNLFATIGGYAEVKLFLRALRDDDELIRHRAAQAIRDWKRQSINVYTPINDADKRGILEQLQILRSEFNNYPDIDVREVSNLEDYLK